ncbi:MAG TPA: hypothetical protein VM073_06140 [Usitatibacter sp.]|nr:hypothetical protein [Usitatibacter sp.]
MAAGDIYRKTALGASEISSRKLKLNSRVRTMLILIDGAQPEFILREEAAKVGAPLVFLDELLRLGLIEKVGRASVPGPATAAAATPAPGPAGDEFSRFRAAKDFMNVTIVDALGIKSFFFTMKLERASTRDDLRALAPAYREAIAKAEEEAQAAVLSARLEEMLR